MENELKIMVQLDYDTYLALDLNDQSHRLMLELVKLPLYARDWDDGKTMYTKKKHGITCTIAPAIIREQAPVVSGE